MDLKKYILVFILGFILNFIISPNEAIAYPQDSSGFIVSALDNNSWIYQGTLHYTYKFETKYLQVNLNSNQEKELKIRIFQVGNEIDAAHLDYVALRIGDKEVLPDSITDLNNQNDLLFKTSKLDNNVADVTRHTIEAVWTNLNADNPILILNAREEILKELPGEPFKLPFSLNLSDERTFMTYKLKNDGSIDINKLVNNAVEADKPTFIFYLVPVSGHPPGFAYFYLKNDKNYLYIVQDITSHNTLDTVDWSKAYFYTKNGLKEFEVNYTFAKYGRTEHTYTKSVGYQHSVYEFKIPLNEIIVKELDTIKIGFRYYGTDDGDGGDGGDSGDGGGSGSGGTGGEGGSGGSGSSGASGESGESGESGSSSASSESASSESASSEAAAEAAAEATAEATALGGGDGGGGDGGGGGGAGGGGDIIGDGICGPTETCATSPIDCGSCCVANTGSSCGSCGGIVQCDGSCNIPTPANYSQPCGNCGTIGCSGSCINQGPCSPGQTQCANDRYQNCTSGCQWQNSGANADNDAKDLQCGDSLCDNSPNVYDSTKTLTESNCTDGLDNDCDGLTDCMDPDCAGSITGVVKSQDSQPIPSADVIAKKGLAAAASATADFNGVYTISPINCGTYTLIASNPDYASQIIGNVDVEPRQQTTSNFSGSSSLVLGTSCEQDCAYAADGIIHASCSGKNGCAFYDNISKSACDNSHPGWTRDYNSSHYVECASGSPQPKIEIPAEASCASGTLVKTVRIVVYNGKPVKMVVAVCG